MESWQSLVVKLRHLLLLSLNRHLGKFEDQVRSLREKRTEPDWSFTTYFLLHVSRSCHLTDLGALVMAGKMSLENKHLHNCAYFVIIPSCSHPAILAKYAINSLVCALLN